MYFSYSNSLDWFSGLQLKHASIFPILSMQNRRVLTKADFANRIKLVANRWIQLHIIAIATTVFTEPGYLDIHTFSAVNGYNHLHHLPICNVITYFINKSSHKYQGSKRRQYIHSAQASNPLAMRARHSKYATNRVRELPIIELFSQSAEATLHFRSIMF